MLKTRAKEKRDREEVTRTRFEVGTILDRKNWYLLPTMIMGLWLLCGSYFFYCGSLRMIWPMIGGGMGGHVIARLFIIRSEDKRSKRDQGTHGFEPAPFQYHVVRSDNSSPRSPRFNSMADLNRYINELRVQQAQMSTPPIITATQLNRPNANVSQPTNEWNHLVLDYVDRIAISDRTGRNPESRPPPAPAPRPPSNPAKESDSSNQDPVIKKVKNAIEQLEVSD